VRVGDHDIAVAVDKEAGRFAVGMVGGGPTAEERAVVLEDLYTGGLVDDVEVLIAVDGDGPRRLKAAVGDAESAPDGFDRADAGGVAKAAGEEGEEAGGETVPST
jgi:hypothetical protein